MIDCVVGCTTCANLCQGEALTFPGVEELRELYQTERLWAKGYQGIKTDLPSNHLKSGFRIIKPLY